MQGCRAVCSDIHIQGWLCGIRELKCFGFRGFRFSLEEHMDFSVGARRLLGFSTLGLCGWDLEWLGLG